MSKPQANTKPKQHTKLGDKDCKDKLWASAKTIPGKDPNLYRLDPYGNEIYYHSFGKNSEKGWTSDHIKPSSRGGSDTIRNLQALKTSINIDKGNTLVKKSRHSKSNK